MVEHAFGLGYECTDATLPVSLIGFVECRYEILGIALDFFHVDPVFVECNVLPHGAPLTP